MPWYYCYADFGPGHQSSGERLVYDPYKLSRSQREEVFNEVFGEYEYPIGDVKLVKTLTKAEKTDLLIKYRNEVNYAQGMIDVLNKTPIQKSLRPRQLKAERWSLRDKKLLKEAQKRNREEQAAKNG